MADADGRRVSGQACVSAGPRCHRGSAVGRIGSTSRKCHISWGFAPGGLLGQRGTWPATIRGGESGGPNLACLPKGCAAGGAVDFCWVRRGGAWHSKRPKAEEGSLDFAPVLRSAQAGGQAKKMTKSIHVGGRPVWAEISLQAILRNLEIIREHVNRGQIRRGWGRTAEDRRQKQIPRLRSG